MPNLIHSNQLLYPLSGSFSGSLQGTSSYATTASYVISSSYAISASYSTTSSYAVSSSYALSSSQATSASYAFSASYAASASYATSASYVVSSSYALSASFATSASFAISASWAPPSSVSAGGTDKSIQFNNNGPLSGSNNFTFDKATSQVSLTGSMDLAGYVKFDPVTTNINQSISASYIYVSGSTQDLYFTQNGSGYGNTTRLRWLESVLYTGILNGGVLTSTPGTTTFSITSGSGLIVTQNASTNNNPYPVVKQISWPTQTLPITYSGSAKITYVGIDNTGTIIQQTVPWGTLDINQWDNSIAIGVVLTLSGSVSTGVFNSPQISYGPAQKTDDFFRAFGPLKMSGHTLRASGSSPTLSIIKDAGTSYREGANYVINPNHPSTVVENSINTSKIYRYYISGSTPVIDTGVNNAGYTAIDSKNYVDTTTGQLALVGGAYWSIQRVFWVPNSPTNAFIVYYGNDRYRSLVDATNARDSEPFVEAPNTAQNAIFIGYIIIQGGGSGTPARDLLNASEATILQAGLFRSIGGVGSSGTNFVSTTLAGLADVSLSGNTPGDLLVYGTNSTWNNKKQLTGSYELTGSLVVTQNISASSFTGSLFGTATTASYVLQAVSSSFASTASYVQTAQTASYVLQAVSASFASTVPSTGIIGNITRIATGSVTASVTPTGFTVVSGSSTELSVTGTGVTIGNAITDTHRITGSLAITGSAAIVGSFNVGTALNVTASTNNVQIGTTVDAGFKLDVNGTTRLAGATTVTGNTYLGTTSLSRVGIFTTTPTASLHILGTISGSGPVTGNEVLRGTWLQSVLHPSSSGGTLYGLEVNPTFDRVFPGDGSSPYTQYNTRMFMSASATASSDGLGILTLEGTLTDNNSVNNTTVRLINITPTVNRILGNPSNTLLFNNSIYSAPTIQTGSGASTTLNGYWRDIVSVPTVRGFQNIEQVMCFYASPTVIPTANQNGLWGYYYSGSGGTAINHTAYENVNGNNALNTLSGSTFIGYPTKNNTTTFKLDVLGNTRLSGSLNISGSITVTGSLLMPSGSNTRVGTATLVGGNTLVANTTVTANSLIYLTTQTVGGILGALYIGAKSAGTSFAVSSSNVADTSTFAYFIIN